jgi:hypothetical protein
LKVWVAPRATFCRDLQAPRWKNAPLQDGRNNRSKFNVPLGVEAQAFCILG